jgi:signal transduction histidine kinase
MTRADVEVALIALAYSGAAGVTGLVAVRMWRRRSVRGFLVACSLITLASVVAGVLGAARAMFISTHDLAVVLPVTAMASLVAMGISWLLGRTVVRDVQRVRSTARALGSSPDADADAGAHRDGAGRARAAVSLRELCDIESDVRRAQARLAAARSREQALEASRRELVAWISHDLRTPLAGLRAMAEALEDGVAADPARYHRQMRREVDRLSRLVDDLFELSRIRGGGLSLTLEHVDLRDLVADVVSGSTAMAEAGGVSIGASADAATLRADAGGLGRVLTNLVVNAIRHTPSDGTVHVAAQQRDGEVVLSVSDACGGIPPSDLEHLFEPGWRGGGRARTPRPDGGAGLGLAIARGIVEAHQGRITAYNIGDGCCFDVRLPLALNPA